MFEQTKPRLGRQRQDPGPSQETGRGDAEPRVRLAQLAAQAEGRGGIPDGADGRDGLDADGPAGAPPSQPRHALSGRAGRLVERWLPSGADAVPSRRRRGTVAVALLGVVAVVVGAALLAGGSPPEERPPPLPVADAHGSSASTPTPPGSRPAAAASATTPPSSGPLVVSVVGKVKRPGLITVRQGARVADAIEAAGGAHRNADLHTVNLARRLQDGEQVYVGVPVPPGMASPAAGQGDAPGAPGAGAQEETAVDLNAADQDHLETLPGVGEVTAERILEWRAEHGRFTAVEQLREIDGIGQKRFAELRERVTVR